MCNELVTNSTPDIAVTLSGNPAHVDQVGGCTAGRLLTLSLAYRHSGSSAPHCRADFHEGGLSPQAIRGSIDGSGPWRGIILKLTPSKLAYLHPLAPSTGASIH